MLQAALYEAVVGDHGGRAVVLVVRVERVGEPLPGAYICRRQTEENTKRGRCQCTGIDGECTRRILVEAL